MGHRLGQPTSEPLACEVVESETVEIASDGAVLLRYSLSADGKTEQLDFDPGTVDVENGAQRALGVGGAVREARVVFFEGDIVATIQLLDDQRSFVKVFPDGIQVASPADV